MGNEKNIYSRKSRLKKKLDKKDKSAVFEQDHTLPLSSQISEAKTLLQPRRQGFLSPQLPGGGLSSWD